MNFCKFDDIEIKDKEKILNQIENPKTFIVKLFPYFVNNDKGNISKYARGKDYHEVVMEKLYEIVCEYKEKYPQNTFLRYCDISPLPEVEIAYKSGAGIKGKNNLIFDDEYGGYVFIGIILTDLEIDFEKKQGRNCIDCNECVKKCPTGAITSNGIDEKKCMSYITQSSDEISDENLIKKSNLIWGCDICLDVCHMNKNAKKTEITEFRENLVAELVESDVSGITRKQFRENFPHRAFTFKGPRPIERNLKIKNNN